MKLELGAVGVFKGAANLTDISILPADTGIRRWVKDAAVHSKVYVMCVQHAGRHSAFSLKLLG